MSARKTYVLPAFTSNIYEYLVDELDDLYVLVTRSDYLKVSLSKALVNLRSIIKQRWLGKVFAYIRDNYLVVLTPSSEAKSDLVQILAEYRKGDISRGWEFRSVANPPALPRPSLALRKTSSLKALGLEFHSFTTIQQPFKPVVYAALARALLHHTLLSLSSEGWTLLGRARAYTTRNYSDFVVDLPSPVGEYVSLYRGTEIATLPLEVYAFGKRFQSLGLCIDYAVILEPLKTLQELIDEGLKYSEGSLMIKGEERDEQFGYTTVRYETWDIDELGPRTAKVYRLRKVEGGAWQPQQDEVELKNAYPLRRPEVIDRMIRSRHELRESLTSIVKRESFLVTSEGHRNENAPRLRLEFTERIREALAQAVSRHRFLGKLEVTLSDEPFTIEIGLN
ncbi:hypothetical protein [Infirmifilum sp. NZ]|uniref:hypothetical protein n=1 Tax=Infirmifilum sp. NZ TaxID=2926850 RepID=UPI0027A0E0F2|nr:hypothetical protein [Infirmifilum sp. NZ]UNQ73581.1 hypothetical protein MOV14_00860 [Infirmifilum sp. NZ]